MEYTKTERVVRTMLGIEHDDLYLVKLQEYIFLQRSWVSTDDTLCTRGQYKCEYFRYVNERVMPMREREINIFVQHTHSHTSHSTCGGPEDKSLPFVNSPTVGGNHRRSLITCCPNSVGPHMYISVSMPYKRMVDT